MGNFEFIAVLIFGYLIAYQLYPFLDRRGIHIAVTHKYALGHFIAALGMLYGILLGTAHP